MSTQSLAEKAGSPDGERFDPVALAVVTSRIQGIVRRMTNTLFRTARSSVLNTARDFSCCIVTREHEILACAESLPIHVMSGPDMVAASTARLHPRFRAGDAFLHNSPYHGNSHAGDHCMVVPVVDADGTHQFTAIVKAHLSDIGNSQPTTLWANAEDVYNEGALIFPGVKVQSDYADVPDIIEMCRTRIRVPDVWYADFLGMVGAARIGERELLALGAEVGWGHLHEYTTAWFDYSEEMMTAAIRRMPAGRSVARNMHDPVPADGARDGVPVAVTVTVDPEEGRIEVDLRDNPDCLPCGINLTEATSRTSAMIGVFNSLPARVPTNAGSFRRIDVILRENCIAGIPVHPASCSTATTGIADRAANATQRAIAEMAEGFGMAETGTLTAAVVDLFGHDPRRDGDAFVNMMLLGLTGGAGHSRGDGWLVCGEVGDGGQMMRDSTEVLELLYPVVVWADRLVTDTGGPGRRRGAPGCYVEYGPLGTELHAMWSTDGAVHGAIGARGAYPGARAAQFRRGRDGSLTELPGMGEARLLPGETIVASSSAGAGYGLPWERDPARVLHDVSEAWVSAEQAREVYGVRIGDDGVVDEAGTAALRQTLRKESPVPPEELEFERPLMRIVAGLAGYAGGEGMDC